MPTFNPTGPGFSIANAYLLAKASAAAYLDSPMEALPEFGFGETLATFATGSITGFVGATDRVAVVAFRGTVTIEDWLVDGQARQVNDPHYPGLVHRGFRDALESVWPAIRQLIPVPLAERTVWVSGHSLGGALVSLAAGRLEADGVPVAAAYTYGSPRVGDPAFYNGYVPPNYRFVNNNDIVPHVPSESLLIGLRH